jgi:1-aminocyclopropane-1-carboxylate deaminase/D-cysteine desulfhydrase-like pyridoxal-dependent ACC family enzyme
MDVQLSSWFANLKSHSHLESFRLLLLNTEPLQLFVKRDDLIHQEISGNKLRKLQGNLVAAPKAGVRQILTFGGAYSNHLLASAAAAHALGFQIIGRVRGEELNAQSNTLLKHCAQLGMQLEFISRSSYQSQKYQSGLHNIHDQATWVIPEGGANPEGLLGCAEIYQEAVAQNHNQHFDLVCLAQGTTTTSLGILTALPPSTKLLVIPVLKGFDSISEMQTLAHVAHQNPHTAHLQFPLQQVQVLDNYHHGGYAKTTPELLNFTEQFNATNQFPIEPVYTAKALFALQSYLSAEQSINTQNPEPKKILFVHTGGIV